MYTAFLSHIATLGDNPAIVFHGSTVTYGDFHRAVARSTAFLSDHRVRRGAVVAVEGIYTPGNCALMVALIGNGNIVVPLPKGPQAKRAEFLEIAQAEQVISPDDSGAHAVSATGRSADHPLYQRLRQDDAPGLVLFSSGTTGRSKASVLNFAKLLPACGEGTLRPRRTLAFLSLDHIGGINTLLRTFGQGGCIISVAERTPQAVFRAVEDHAVDTLPTTPTFLTMGLISGEMERHDLSSLGLITYGTEPMPAQTLDKLHQLYPKIRLKQTYGLSEVGILPTRSRSDDSLWMTLGSSGFEHKIIDNILWIRSDMAMLGYLNADAPFDDEGYFNTQDVVEVDGPYLRVLGRKSEIINVGGEKVYPNEVESTLLEAGNVAEAVVSGKPSPVTGMVVKALIRLATPEDEGQAKDRLRAYCRDHLEAFKIPVQFTFSDQPQHSDRHKKIRVLP